MSPRRKVFHHRNWSSIYWHVENPAHSIFCHSLSFSCFSHFLFREEAEKFLSPHYNRSVNLYKKIRENCNIKQLMNKRLNCPNALFLSSLLTFQSSAKEKGRKLFGVERMNNFFLAAPSRYHFHIARCVSSFFFFQLAEEIYLNYSWQTN